jgi:polyisoprenoid-binding protein YceI
MILERYFFAIAIAVLAAQPVQIADAQPTARLQDEIVQLDPAHTDIAFTLAGNLHNTNGRFRLKTGIIRLDPETGNATGEITIDTASEASSEHLRDALMKNGILEVDRYPEIIFTPQRILGHRDSQGNFYGQIAGLMRLHGGVHEMTIFVHGHLAGDQLTLLCDFLVPYVEWGIESPNVLTPAQIISSTRESNNGFAPGMFSIFAYLLPMLRKIPPNLFEVSDLVEVKVEAHGHIIWAPDPRVRNVTVITPPR